jgi:hypothetical protein
MKALALHFFHPRARYAGKPEGLKGGLFDRTKMF